MPLLSYFAVIGSVLLGLLFLAEAQLGPAAPSRVETNPLHEQMVQRAERAAKARLPTQTRTVGLTPTPAPGQISTAQGPTAELSAASRAAPAPGTVETQKKTVEKPVKKKKTHVARPKDDNQRYARYHDTGPRQYSIGYQ
jgi:hypothetical protein